MPRWRAVPVLVLAAAIAVAAGCGSRVPPTPPAAQGQPPRGAPLAPWQGRGRLEISFPGTRLSLDCYLRGLGGSGVRLVLVSDGGVQLLDVTVAPAAVDVHQCIDDLKPRVPMLARLVGQAYGPVAETGRAWDDDRLVAHAGSELRWYGGDPLLLRLVEGDGDPLEISDYRPLGGGSELLAHEVVAESTFVRIRLRLATSGPTPAPATRP